MNRLFESCQRFSTVKLDAESLYFTFEPLAFIPDLTRVEEVRFDFRTTTVRLINVSKFINYADKRKLLYNPLR